MNDTDAQSFLTQFMSQAGMGQKLADELGSTGLGAATEKALGITKGEVQFYERVNVSEPQADGTYRIEFKGAFTVDDQLVKPEGSPTTCGFVAMFGEAYGPHEAWLYVDDEFPAYLRPVFEQFFGGTFDESGLRMTLDPEFFSEYAEGPKWMDYNETFGGDSAF